MTDFPPGGASAPPTPPATKDPIVVLLASLLAGAGYFLIGQRTKGIVAVVLWFVVGIPTCGSGAGLLSIVYAVDAFFQAKQLQAGLPIGPWTFFTNHH